MPNKVAKTLGPFRRGVVYSSAFCAWLVGCMPLAFAAPPVVLTQEATIGQQDRSLHVESAPYDNSDFLNDMDAIARGTYVESLEPEADPEETDENE